MKTEVSKKYRWGFVLSEQEVRRIVKTCDEHILKLGLESPHQKFTAKLKDGSLVESEDINDIVSLENEGSKKIQRINILFDDGKEKPEQSIEVEFQDALRDPHGWTSISFTVIGQSRDWAFLAASELEERVRKTKTTALTYIVN